MIMMLRRQEFGGCAASPGGEGRGLVVGEGSTRCQANPNSARVCNLFLRRRRGSGSCSLRRQNPVLSNGRRIPLFSSSLADGSCTKDFTNKAQSLSFSSFVYKTKSTSAVPVHVIASLIVILLLPSLPCYFA